MVKSSLLMLCQKLLRVLSRLIFSKIEVSREERISRFVCNEDDISKTNRVKPSLFSPPKDREMSVYRTSTLAEEVIWFIADEFVSKFRKDGKKVIARGDMQASVYFENHLKVIEKRRPHKNHAVVIEWPEDRAKLQMVKVELSNAAQLFRKP